MIAPSRAGEFYREIVGASDPAGFFNDLVATKFSEAEFLDYKVGGDSNLTTEKIREIWSKWLSGFANTGGGVLIWGIRARDNIPTGLSIVPDVDDFKAKLLKFLPQVTEPPVQGVQVDSFKVTASLSAGFVTCFIPASPWRPHLAIYPDRRYYIRSGDTCVPAPHSILRALFNPSRVSAFEIYGRGMIGGNVPHKIAQFSCWLHNLGPASARDVFLQYKTPKDCSGGIQRKNWTISKSGFAPGFGICSIRPIHPTEMYPIIEVGDMASIDGASFEGAVWTPKPPPLDFSFHVFAEDQLPIQFKLQLTLDDIVAGRNVKAVAKVV